MIALFSVNAQTGTAGSGDFTTTITSVTFQPGETGPKTISIATVDDGIVESNEILTVSLSTTSRVTLGPSSTVSIIDNDGKIYFTISNDVRSLIE